MPVTRQRGSFAIGLALPMFLVTLAVLGAADARAGQAVAREGSNAPAVRDGASIYAFTCSVCHGEDGRGAMWGKTSLDPPPVDFGKPGLAARLSRERMIASVLGGRPGTAMTAFATQLTVAEAADVVDYIRATFMVPAKTARPATTVGQAVAGQLPAAPQPATLQPVPDLPLPDALIGSRENGGRLYARNCTVCHGVDGDGTGPRAYFIFPKPRDFTAPESRARLSRPVLFHAIRVGVPGREMPAWSFVLGDQEIADVAEYVFETFVKPDP